MTRSARYEIITGVEPISRRRPPWNTNLELGRCASPFDVLGAHSRRQARQKGWVVRVFIPWAAEISVLLDGDAVPARRIGRKGAFQAVLRDADGPFEYRLGVTDHNQNHFVLEDPYRFPPALDVPRAQAFLAGE